MRYFQVATVVAALITALPATERAYAQVKYDWIGPVGVEADWDQDLGNVGAGHGDNWLRGTDNLQPDRGFDEYGSISNGGVALIDHDLAVDPTDVRLGETAGTTGSLVIRSGGSIDVQSSPNAIGAGTLANGVAGTGRLTLRDNMGPVTVQRYTQNGASTLVAQLSGVGTFAGANRITASTQISVDGTLRVERAPGSAFTAATGNSWTIISGAPVIGSFDAVSVDPALRSNVGQVFTANTASNAVTVSVEQRLVLQVDRFTGGAKLVNPTGHAVSIPFINYTISSPTNGVSSAAGRWTSLVDNGDLGWFEANPTATQLSELNPQGQLTLNPGQSRAFGTPINANASAPLGTNRVNTGDVTMQYQLPTGEFLSAVVEPVGRFNNLTLVVDPTDGRAIIQNQSGQSIDFISYTISAPAATPSLKPTYSGLSGIPLAGWFKANPTTTNLSELISTSGMATMGVGAEYPLGLAWDPAAGSQELIFRYQTPDGVLRDGAVAFGAKAVIPTSNNADFDGDGDVDGGDFLTWQRGVGATGQPNKATGDANGDGNVTGADLAIWRQRFGTTPPPGAIAAAAVPEPAVGVLATGAIAFLAVRRRAA